MPTYKIDGCNFCDEPRKEVRVWLKHYGLDVLLMIDDQCIAYVSEGGCLILSELSDSEKFKKMGFKIDNIRGDGDFITVGRIFENL